MGEITRFLAATTKPAAGRQRFSTCVQRIDYPFHQGRPNPAHGKFYFVGSIPAACYDFERGKSKYYDTEEEAVEAARAAGAHPIQRCDCSFVEGTG